MGKLTSVEICAGAGGQALGLERAGFDHELAVEIDKPAVETLLLNRGPDGLNPSLAWKEIRCEDVRALDGKQFDGIDLFAGGVPCPPFSVAGKQLGQDDERDLFPTALSLIEDSQPRAVLLENVRGLMSPSFESYRNFIRQELESMGYEVWWNLVKSSDFGVPQLRPRFILVAMRRDDMARFLENLPRTVDRTPTVAETLAPFMEGWPGLADWQQRAQKVAPTIVGGSKKHGGADLGPTRAKAAWAKLGIDGKGVADAFDTTTPEGTMPRLTVEMVAAIQGFPREWKFAGRKTAAYRQVGNAFPPPVAEAIGRSIHLALTKQEPEPVSNDTTPSTVAAS